MNCAPALLKELAARTDYGSIVLAPGMPPLFRSAGSLTAVQPDALTPRDVEETLAGLVSHLSASPPLEQSGRFSFGVKDMGRFGVSYLTQRGSLTIHLKRVPMELPKLEDLVPDREAAREAERFFRQCPPGLLVITGPASALNNLLVYALIRRINETERKVIQIVEDGLTFLVRHGQSVVLQTELGADVDSLTRTLKSLRHMSSDLVYVRDVMTSEELLLIARVAATSLFAVVTTSALDAGRVLREGAGMDPRLLLGVWRIEPTADGQAQLSQDASRS